MKSVQRVIAVIAEGVVTALLVAIYLVVVTGIGLAMRLAGRNPLKRASRGGNFWQSHRGAADRRAMERQS